MSVSGQRRYIVMGDGITVRAQTLEEAISAFRAASREVPAPQRPNTRIEEPVGLSEGKPLSAI